MPEDKNYITSEEKRVGYHGWAGSRGLSCQAAAPWGIWPEGTHLRHGPRRVLDIGPACAGVQILRRSAGAREGQRRGFRAVHHGRGDGTQGYHRNATSIRACLQMLIFTQVLCIPCWVCRRNCTRRCSPWHVSSAGARIAWRSWSTRIRSSVRRTAACSLRSLIFLLRNAET